jgi:hypothetical protein
MDAGFGEGGGIKADSDEARSFIGFPFLPSNQPKRASLRLDDCGCERGQRFTASRELMSAVLRTYNNSKSLARKFSFDLAKWVCCSRIESKVNFL